MADMLRRDGYEVVEAPDGAIVLLLAFAAPVDVLLIDLRLPYLDAFEVLERLHSKKIAPRVIVMTGDLSYDVELHAKRFGVRLLTKPFTYDELLQEIRKL